VFIADDEQETAPRVVSIFILTEGDNGGLFLNMVFTVLLIWLSM
jgi:hypothetical protein